MYRNILESRMKDIQEAVERSIASHHMLLGRLEEAKYMMQLLEMQELVDNGEAVE